jgi:hypothetical protein
MDPPVRYPSVSLPGQQDVRSEQLNWCRSNLEDNQWDWDPLTDCILFVDNDIKLQFLLSWG